MKDLKISKELLRAVLPKETESLSNEFSFYINDDYIVFCDEGEQLFDYCIYKFAFKCKEWALENGYELLSLDKECFLYDTQELYDVSEQLDQWLEWFEAKTEQQAIIKACEWILTQKDM